MYYKTRTYIAADWSGDYDAVERLHKWNNSKYWSLSFTDAHDLMQARDNSLNCSIKCKSFRYQYKIYLECDDKG